MSTGRFAVISWRLLNLLYTDHTAANLATGLEESLTRWKLPMIKFSAATTDNARNIVAAHEILHWQQLGCFAHTLPLGVKKAMAVPEMARALDRAKRLLGDFHHSIKSTNVIHQKQKDLRHDEQNLVQASYTLSQMLISLTGLYSPKGCTL